MRDATEYEGPTALTLARIRHQQLTYSNPRDPEFMDEQEIAAHFGVDQDDVLPMPKRSLYDHK